MDVVDTSWIGFVAAPVAELGTRALVAPTDRQHVRGAFSGSPCRHAERRPGAPPNCHHRPAQCRRQVHHAGVGGEDGTGSANQRG